MPIEPGNEMMSRWRFDMSESHTKDVTHFLEKMYDDAVQQIPHRVVRQDIPAHVHSDVSGQSGFECWNGTLSSPPSPPPSHTPRHPHTHPRTATQPRRTDTHSHPPTHTHTQSHNTHTHTHTPHAHTCTGL